MARPVTTVDVASMTMSAGKSISPAPCDPANPNASLDGSGHLLIQALRVSGETAPGSNAWTSARLNTANDRASFRYGRIESRMQLPTGPGIWPAFWALGTNIGTVDWPTCGEMDFMENVPLVGHLGPKVVKSTIHGPGYSGGHGLGKDYSLSTDVTEFHSYGAIWSPFMVQFYVDDPANVFFIRTPRDLPAGKEWVYEHPFFLLLNLAVGGIGSWPGPPDASTPNPARMVVDYVRVFRAPDTSERFETTFTDSFSGWQEVVLPFGRFTRSAVQPAGAPDDGLTLSDVWGYRFQLPAQANSSTSFSEGRRPNFSYKPSSQRRTSWFARPCRGPARLFKPAENA